MTKKAPLRVMLVDDHEIVRDGIKAMLDAEDDVVVTAQAGTVREAIDEAHRTRPDVVVMDVRLADGSGIEATREIRVDHPETRVLMLTSFADDEALFASIMAGASGYVLKQVKSGDLLRAIRAVGAGDSLLDPSVTNAVLDRLRKGKHLMKDEKLARLSPQEERILTLVADGRTNKEIGDETHPRREDREELRLLDPLQARGRATQPKRPPTSPGTPPRRAPSRSSTTGHGPKVPCHPPQWTPGPWSRPTGATSLVPHPPLRGNIAPVNEGGGVHGYAGSHGPSSRSRSPR